MRSRSWGAVSANATGQLRRRWSLVARVSRRRFRQLIDTFRRVRTPTARRRARRRLGDVVAGLCTADSDAVVDVETERTDESMA